LAYHSRPSIERNYARPPTRYALAAADLVARSINHNRGDITP